RAHRSYVRGWKIGPSHFLNQDLAANMSGDPEQEYFADGMVEEIATALSRLRWFFVIVRNSTFTYKGRAVDVKQIGRELGVRYVLARSSLRPRVRQRAAMRR